MKRLLLFLPLPCLLLGLWLTLNDSLSIEQILLGSVIAVVLGLLAPKLRPVRARPKHPWVALRLLGHVSIDILMANWAVGKRIALGKSAAAHPDFLEIPLRIHDPHGQAALACIVTFTPGTVWAGLDPETHVLRLHVLDLQDPDGLSATIQMRYERPLMEIFE